MTFSVTRYTLHATRYMKVLKFGAVWCKECLVMKPMWAEIEKEIPDLITEYFDADMSPEEVKKRNIDILPTFKDGNEIVRLTGAQNKDDLVNLVKENLDK